MRLRPARLPVLLLPRASPAFQQRVYARYAIEDSVIPGRRGMRRTERRFMSCRNWDAPAMVRRYAHLATGHLAVYVGRVEMMGTNSSQQLSS